ncbi:MAG: hypothetical protein ACI8T1_004002 [Verrucomicrobiales bacterium]|jgi:hypothetical protein
MQYIDEALVKVIWMKLSAQPPEDTLASMQRFREEQEPLFVRLTAELGETYSETALEILLYLAVTVYQVVAWRRLPKGPLPLPMIDDAMVHRCGEKRAGTVGAYLGGKQAQAEDLGDALESLVDRFELPQLSLLGHATEGLLAAHEDGDLTRAEVEASFVRILILLDGLDRVVKS